MKNRLLELLITVIFVHYNSINAQTATFSKSSLAYSSDWSTVNFLDLNQDGYLDIFASTIVDNQAHTYHENDKNGGFLNDYSLFSTGGLAYSSAWADVENDGDLDLILSMDGKVKFIYNNGERGFNYSSGSYLKSNSRVDWVDYDNNNWLDVSSGIYLHAQDSQYSFTSQPDFTFSGSASWCDFDNDGDADVLANALLKNNGDGTFTDITSSAFPSGYSYNGQTISWGDFNNDGWFDVFVSNNTADQVFKNNGDGTFTKISNAAFPNDYSSAYTSAWADYNNDGYLDLYTASNILVNSSIQSNNLYLNNHDGTFIIADAAVLKFQSYESWRTTSCAWGDINNDGLQDLLIGRKNWGLTLYENTNDDYNNWVTIKLKGVKSNTSAIGAKVHVTSELQGVQVTQVREIRAINGGGQSSMEAAFGLGDGSIINSIEIHWPSGLINKYNDVLTNQIITYTEHDESTSIEENDYTDDFKPVVIYNSTSGSYTLISKFKNYDVEILDINGKVIYSVQNVMSENYKIDLSDTPKGYYLLKTKNKTSQSIQSIIHY